MKVPTDGSFDHLNVESVIDPTTAKKVISSTQLIDWEKTSIVKQFPDKISKMVIPIDFAHYRMNIVTKVEAGVVVDTHMHEEPIFRFIIEGDLNLNGIEHRKGDWVLVPSNTPYRVTTKKGYTALSKYGAKCGSPHDDVISRNDNT